MIINPQKVQLEPIVGFDLETTGLEAWNCKIVAISISTSKETYVLDARKYSRDYLLKLFEGLSQCLVIGQNLKFDCSFVWYHYNILFKNIWDTLLVEQIVTNGLPNLEYGLTDIIERNLQIKLYEDKKIKEYYQMSFVGLSDNQELSDEQYKYAGDDTHYLLPLYEVQKEAVEELHQEKIVALEHKLLPVLTKIEVGGCLIDRAGWTTNIKKVWKNERLHYINLLDTEVQTLSQANSKLKSKYGQDRNRNITTVFSLFDAPKQVVTESSNCLNYASSDQVLDMFKLLGLPVPTKLTATGVAETVGEGELTTYVIENPDTPLKRFIELLLKYREYEKLISTYGDKFLARLDKNNYIHTTYSQCYTDTGRLASRNPNLQNIPSMDDQEIAYLLEKYNTPCEIRSFFIPDNGDVMITADMSGAEIRIAADYSQEPKLIKSILEDEDLHSKLASISYSIIFDRTVQISKSKNPIIIDGHSLIPQTLRDTHKSVLFAKFYKGGAKRVYDVLAEYINMFHQGEATKDISQRISKAIDRQLPKLSKYLTSLIDQAKEEGFLIGSKLGRIRYFDKEKVYGEAANYPIQNTNGEALKIAMIKMDQYLEGKGRIVLNVHDELVLSVKPIYVIEAAVMLRKVMSESLGWFLKTIPGDSTVTLGDYWIKSITMGKIEQYLLKNGYEIYYFKDGKWVIYPKEVNPYYSTMVNVVFQFRKGEDIITCGLNEAGKPPTLVYPRPKGVTSDDEMNRIIEQHTAEEILQMIK